MRCKVLGSAKIWQDGPDSIFATSGVWQAAHWVYPLVRGYRTLVKLVKGAS